jgi:4-hydroxy-2-oxoheptanedioate aldolase
MKNKLKQLLAHGKPAIGSWVGFGDAYAVEMMADLGFDWLLIDMEHFPLSKESLRTMLMACKGSDTAPVVRVPVSSVDYIQAALDLGAQGVMAPMINSAGDAKSAVDFSRYPPLGRRGFGPIRASQYLKDLEKYRHEANDEIALFLQIETPEAVSHAREILDTKGIDGVFIGNGDLANFMNHGQPCDAVQEVVDRVIDLACGISMPVGLPVWSQPECNRYVERGARLLTIGSDMGFLASGARAELSATRKLLESTKRQHAQP